MKVLPTARILIIDPQTDRRQSLREALVTFGIGEILEAAMLEEISLRPPEADLLVVHADNAENIPENPFRDGNGMPAVLIAPLPAASLERMQIQKGYEGALAAPAAPRMLYRRIGCVLQQARRASRAIRPETPEATEAPAPPLP
ncbi:hypothetical protein ACT6QH_13435 [Xanthobacter sp. TB0139]|uniref:hypothetical protein n=1 Tax=Xanthobacter sp. TB0139 TaxID=3459178 RepID=UPI004039E7F7